MASIQRALGAEIEAFVPTTFPLAMKGIRRFVGKKQRCDEQRARIAQAPQDKGARMPTGAVRVCHHNAGVHVEARDLRCPGTLRVSAEALVVGSLKLPRLQNPTSMHTSVTE